MRSIIMPSVLFVLERILEYDFEESVEDTEEYDQKLYTDWLSFWEVKGEEIISSSWSLKYSDYLLNEDDDVDRRKPKDTKTEQDSEENSFQFQTDEACASWQELWDEQYTDLYTKTYQNFSTAHYHQYYFYKPKLEETIKYLECESPSESEENTFETLNQNEELLALGLPTSFGGRNNKYHKSRLYDSSSSSESLDKQETEEKDMPPTHKKTPPKKKKQSKDHKIPEIIRQNHLRRYWQKRFSLFSRFDEGIQLDRESWFSVTPEKVAVHMAERLRCDTIIDAFCGSGGNAIQFALTCTKVIAIDIDGVKIKNAKHNANVYGVANKIEFIIGDFLQLCDSLKGDVVFLSPPWGGPNYVKQESYDIEESLAPLGATALAEKARQISDNIAFFLPRNSIPKQMAKVAGVGKRVEIQHNYLDRRYIGLTAIYGDWLIDKRNLNE